MRRYLACAAIDVSLKNRDIVFRDLRLLSLRQNIEYASISFKDKGGVMSKLVMSKDGMGGNEKVERDQGGHPLVICLYIHQIDVSLSSIEKKISFQP